MKKYEINKNNFAFGEDSDFNDATLQQMFLEQRDDWISEGIKQRTPEWYAARRGMVTASALLDEEGNKLSPEELAIQLAARKLDLDEEFLGKRGDKVWNHRRKSSGYISGTLRYEILKRAKFRCELCGISADQKALEVDHIVPRNNGGGDDQSNLQALCYSCNAMKRDRDDTDFREINKSYEHRESGCIFCEIPKERVIAENELAYAILDAFAVTEQHTLIIPKRHVSDYFRLHQPERNAMHRLLEERRQAIMDSDNTVTGFNVGNNVGEDAGQTVMHCHTHLIPRRKGDVEEPRGGVRGVISDKQKY